MVFGDTILGYLTHTLQSAYSSALFAWNHYLFVYFDLGTLFALKKRLNRGPKVQILVTALF